MHSSLNANIANCKNLIRSPVGSVTSSSHSTPGEPYKRMRPRAVPCVDDHNDKTGCILGM